MSCTTKLTQFEQRGGGYCNNHPEMAIWLIRVALFYCPC